MYIVIYYTISIQGDFTWRQNIGKKIFHKLFFFFVFLGLKIFQKILPPDSSAPSLVNSKQAHIWSLFFLRRTNEVITFNLWHIHGFHAGQEFWNLEYVWNANFKQNIYLKFLKYKYEYVLYLVDYISFEMWCDYMLCFAKLIVSHLKCDVIMCYV